MDGRINQALSDTTVQENDVTFPTDAKLANKVIDHCNRIARAEHVDQRQSYVQVIKQLLRDSYFGHHPRRHKKTRRARKKLRTIAGRLLRELERELIPRSTQCTQTADRLVLESHHPTAIGRR